MCLKLLLGIQIVALVYLHKAVWQKNSLTIGGHLCVVYHHMTLLDVVPLFLVLNRKEAAAWMDDMFDPLGQCISGLYSDFVFFMSLLCSRH